RQRGRRAPLKAVKGSVPGPGCEKSVNPASGRKVLPQMAYLYPVHPEGQLPRIPRHGIVHLDHDFNGMPVVVYRQAGVATYRGVAPVAQVTGRHTLGAAEGDIAGKIIGPAHAEPIKVGIYRGPLRLQSYGEELIAA